MDVAASGRLTASFWGCIWVGGAIALVEISPRMNAIEYCSVLESVLVPHKAALFGENEGFTFVRDNATIHNARLTWQRIAAHPHITQLNWPPAHQI